jgi:hypothetical protein
LVSEAALLLASEGALGLGSRHEQIANNGISSCFLPAAARQRWAVVQPHHIPQPTHLVGNPAVN